MTFSLLLITSLVKTRFDPTGYLCTVTPVSNLMIVTLRLGRFEYRITSDYVIIYLLSNPYLVTGGAYLGEGVSDKASLGRHSPAPRDYKLRDKPNIFE